MHDFSIRTRRAVATAALILALCAETVLAKDERPRGSERSFVERLIAWAKDQLSIPPGK